MDGQTEVIYFFLLSEGISWQLRKFWNAGFIHSKQDFLHPIWVNLAKNIIFVNFR